MIEQNIRFQEAYKRLDNLCKDCYGSQEGVSEYIRQMDRYMFDGETIVPSWKSDYKNLKHIRWVRNQLAHEVGTLNSDIVKDDDLSFVTNFTQKIMNAVDPLSQLRQYRQSKNQTKHQVSTQNYNTPSYTHTQPKPAKKNFLTRLLEKIKNLFKWLTIHFVRKTYTFWCRFFIFDWLSVESYPPCFPFLVNKSKTKRNYPQKPPQIIEQTHLLC